MKKTAFVTMRWPSDLLEELRNIADQEDRTIAGQIIYFARAAVKQYRVKSGDVLSIPPNKVTQLNTGKERQA